MTVFAIDVQACRGRQRRLLESMQESGIDHAVLTRTEHVQYLAGPRFPWALVPICVLAADGTATLIAPHKEPETSAADQVAWYDAKWHSTMRNDQLSAAAACLFDLLPELKTARRVGVEYSICGPAITSQLAGSVVDIEATLFRLRRRKDADELARIRQAITATGRMYERARFMIEPGVSELDVFNALQTAAVEECGEVLTGTGNDYQCYSRGGPPRSRRAQAGELYILDLGPAFQGYYADNARTVAVTTATDEQLQAWEAVVSALEHVERRVKPGVSCRQLFQEVQEMLDACPIGVFNHHLGHGIGLFPHEGPHLNPHWDDTFEVGDVFTAEPGLYDAERLRAGIRIENDYLVTPDGVERLHDFPLEL